MLKSTTFELIVKFTNEMVIISKVKLKAMVKSTTLKLKRNYVLLSLQYDVETCFGVYDSYLKCTLTEFTGWKQQLLHVRKFLQGDVAAVRDRTVRYKHLSVAFNTDKGLSH